MITFDRPSIDDTMLMVAQILAQRATCVKLSVGCVLTDARGRIVGAGYNGVPVGMTHCTDEACPGATMPAGSDTCEAVHAEQNALLNCPDPWAIVTCYVTHGPCLRCTKLLLNTGCRRIVFPGCDEATADFGGRALWEKGGGIVSSGDTYD